MKKGRLQCSVPAFFSSQNLPGQCRRKRKPKIFIYVKQYNKNVLVKENIKTQKYVQDKQKIGKCIFIMYKMPIKKLFNSNKNVLNALTNHI